MTQENFSTFYNRAIERKGGKQNLHQLLTQPKAQKEIQTIADDRWLSGFTIKVFQSGIRWDVVRKKWPNFEALFFNFNPETLLLLSDEQWEKKASDPKIIRHLTKVMSIPHNAQMILDAKRKFGSFGQMISQWPPESLIELWIYLKKNGKRLGGNTGPYSLRQMGVDTFLLTNDIQHYLKHTNVIDSGIQSKRALLSTNNAFIEWQQQSGLSFNEISQIIAYSVGDNNQ